MEIAVRIGEIVGTTQGVGTVSGVLPGSRQIGNETVRQAIVQTSPTPTFPQDEVRLSENARLRLEQQDAAARIGGIVNTPQGPSTVVSILPGGQQAVTQPLTNQGNSETSTAATSAAATSTNTRQTPVYTPTSESELSPEARDNLRELQGIDRAVKAEEQTHAAVAGAYGSTPQYTYVRGPDGRQYAVGGSVAVDTSSAVTPEQAQQAAGAVAASAASVSTPSSADFQAVAQANANQSSNENRPSTTSPEQRDATTFQSGNTQQNVSTAYDPAERVREQARMAYSSWQNAPAGAQLNVAA